MSLEMEMRAIRQSAALSGTEGRLIFRLSGPGAHAAADRLCPRDLFLRDGQMLHTLLLNERANPIADLYLCSDGEDYLLVCEGLPAAELLALIKDRIPTGSKTAIADLTEDRELVSLNGPYAWEVLSEITSPEVIGLPYLGFFHGDGFTCFRAGQTGEYSFDLLLPKAQAAKMRERILETGSAFGLRTAGREALDLCALENFFFNIRMDAHPDITPIEMQLQWRISYQKDFVGSEALGQRRRHASKRAVLIASQAPMQKLDALSDGGRAVGSVLHSAWSFDRGEWLGLALLDRQYAHPGTRVACLPMRPTAPASGLSAPGPSANGDKAMVLSAPAINNRSVYVDPQRHSYATRDEDAFPPLLMKVAR